MITDEIGRIKNISKEDDLHSGHSVCNTCGKDMLICWDTVCCKCGNTSCYKCSAGDEKYWFCFECWNLNIGS